MSGLLNSPKLLRLAQAWAYACAFSAVLATTPAQCAPAATLTELWRSLGTCARVTGVPAEAVGSELTVLFSLKRDGSLQGQPRITHSHLLGDVTAQRAFMAAALSGLSGCLPVPITADLGGAIAGRPLRLRLLSQRPDRAAEADGTNMTVVDAAVPISSDHHRLRNRNLL